MVAGIGCFVCSSFNRQSVGRVVASTEYSVQRRSSPGCDDTFHSNTSTTAYTDQCLAGKKGRWAAVARSGHSSACCVSRDGVFPASHCIKLVGVLGKSRHLDTATV